MQAAIADVLNGQERLPLPLERIRAGEFAAVLTEVRWPEGAAAVLDAARAAYEWSRRTQRPDGSWPIQLRGDVVEDHAEPGLDPVEGRGRPGL